MRPKNGSDTWARTRDKLINSQVLYQLSYVGIKFISKNNNIISCSFLKITASRIELEPSPYRGPNAS